jgi:hypothetical protein
MDTGEEYRPRTIAAQYATETAKARVYGFLYDIKRSAVSESDPQPDVVALHSNLTCCSAAGHEPGRTGAVLMARPQQQTVRFHVAEL